MQPIYLDLHIHTSDNADKPVSDYDLSMLIGNVISISDNADFLLSFTDHNTINKNVYLKAKDVLKYLLVGVELHIRNYPDAKPYHCHIYFDIDPFNEKEIDKINTILDQLYPKKMVGNADKIPSLEDIIKAFDIYEFLLLPHGGQSHSTFDKSIPEGVRFDNRIERSIYYNQFDGFTARSNTGLETTLEYFKKLGISEFVNLITCTDNYKPQHYPNAKAQDAEEFIPTWMMAQPTFDGLRLSLSESSRFKYSKNKPASWSEYIKTAKLKNEYVDMDVELTPGLNVIIGGSSSGKTLFVDSLTNKINGSFNGSPYLKYQVENIIVDNPSGTKPHYISQNYIMKVVDPGSTNNTIDRINIIKNVFPGDSNVKNEIERELSKFRDTLKKLVRSVEILDNDTVNLEKIPVLSRLITTDSVKDNLINVFLPTKEQIDTFEYPKQKKYDHIDILNEIDDMLEKNPFIVHDKVLINKLKEEIESAYDYSRLEIFTRDIIKEEKNALDQNLRSSNVEQQTKKQNFEKLLTHISSYSIALNDFHKSLEDISKYSISATSNMVESMGHKLYIQNNFTLNPSKFLEVINNRLKTEKSINNFDKLQPENLFSTNFKQRPLVRNYADFETKVLTDLEELNSKTYKIETNDGRDFENLSAGWKTSIILDILLGYDKDIAPLIIDQPEDNLATDYINKGLIKAIKNIKSKKQIILVSHNATIPMLGDAQNIILCTNIDGIIKIRSAKLEDKINNKSVVDHIAEITDGGKRSIKKRVKKYNLKTFRE